MEFFIKFNDPNAYEINSKKNDFLGQNSSKFYRNTIQRQLNTASWTELIQASDEFFMLAFDLNNEKELNFSIQKKEPMVKMIFSLSATFMYNFEGLSKTLVVQPNQHNIIYFNKFDAECQWAPGNHQEYLQIYLDVDFIKKVIPESAIYEDFLYFLECESLGFLSPHNLPISSEMLLLIQDILQNKREGILGKLYLQSKLLELLMLQLEQFESIADNPLFKKVNKLDLDKMVQAKDIISSNLENPCTLIDLAHKVGTNEFNLKKSFKEVFGTTVFGYLTQMRMKKAKDMLLTGKYSINHIAFSVGYSDATNFTVAFKKTFGITPSSIIKQNKLTQN